MSDRLHPMLHDLKTHPIAFEPMLAGLKRAEFRKNDRGYKVGDDLKLREWDPATNAFTGRLIFAEITHILEGPSFGVPEGFAMLSLGSMLNGKTGKLILQ